MRIFTTTLRNKKYSQILNKNTSPYFHSASLAIGPFTMLKRTHFSELSISRFTTYFLFLRAVVNIPIQTLIISPWLLFRKMIISQLELGRLWSD